MSLRVRGAPTVNVSVGSIGASGIATSANQTNGNQRTGLIGKSSVNLARLDYTGTNVTTSAYVQLLASTSDSVTQLFIFDSSGQTLVLATGAMGFEADQIYIPPGGNGVIDLAIASGVRVSLKAVSGTANAGEINVSFLK